MNPTESIFAPTHVVVNLGSYVLAGCREDDKERIRAILNAGFVPTEVAPEAAVEGFIYFRSTFQEST